MENRSPDLDRRRFIERSLRISSVGVLAGMSFEEQALLAWADADAVSVSYRRLPRDVEKGDVVLIDGPPGMTAEQLARIFRPFQTTKPKGTGLGLAIVKRIIDLHHSNIEVFSQPGKGTTFSVLLPVDEDN